MIACSACHQAHHAGTLTITGTADALVVRRPAHAVIDAARAHVDARAPVDIADADATTSDPGRPASARGERADTRPLMDVERARVDARAPVDIADADAITSDPGRPPSAIAEHAALSACAASAPSLVRSMEADASTGAQPAGDRDTAGSRDASTVIARETGRSGNRLELATRHAQTKAALRALGWSASIAQAATVAASIQVGPNASIEQWIREALRHCPRPVTSQCPPRGI